MNFTIAEERLGRQLLTREGLRTASDVVGWFGAVQAQEYETAKWALGLRLGAGAVDDTIERAFDDGLILRTHVMRPTWHFVASADIRWLLALTGPRLQRVLAPYDRKLELDARIITRGFRVIERALRDRVFLTRQELRARLLAARLDIAGQRLAHLLAQAEFQCVVCSGPRRGKEFTYALMNERAAGAAALPRDEALATLGRRFLRSHAPATIRDFVWWSGLVTADAKRAFEMIAARREEIDGLAYWTIEEAPRGARREGAVQLLPIYDEYIVAYRDRAAVPHGTFPIASGALRPVLFQHALVFGGQVAGTWRLTRRPGRHVLRAIPARRLTRPERDALTEAVRRYERFVSTPVEFTVG